MTYHSLMELHASSMNIFSKLSQYNATTGDLSGTCNKHIEVTPEAVQNYINVAGYANDGYLQNRLDEFVPSYLGGLDLQQRQHFCKTTTQVLRKLARDNYPTHVGSVIFFDWGTPRIYLFDSKSDTESANTATPSHKKHPVSRLNEKEEEGTNSPLSTSADSFQRRLLRQQVQIDDNNSHDDDLQVKPTSPSPNDNGNSLRQAVEQQQAIEDDDDDDEKKKRDRRLQKQRNRQRQSQQQSKADQYDNNVNKPLSPEWQQAVNKYLAHEKAVQDALKHPKPKRWNGSNSGSRGGRNGRSYHPTNNGPSI